VELFNLVEGSPGEDSSRFSVHQEVSCPRAGSPCAHGSGIHEPFAGPVLAWCERGAGTWEESGTNWGPCLGGWRRL